MHTIELSPRLLALAEQVPQGARFADVGTDHARLPVWLLERGIIASAIATDLREGPLDRARKTAARYGLTDRMDFRLGDGLGPLEPGEANVVAIAGMGGETIADILAEAPWTREEAGLLLLQPMTSAQDLRAWLWRNGFLIQSERLVQEERTIYVLLTVTPGRMPPLSPAEEWCGRQSPEMEAPLRGEYLAVMEERVRHALEGLRRSTREEDRQRSEAWACLAAGIGELKEEWEQWQK